MVENLQQFLKMAQSRGGRAIDQRPLEPVVATIAIGRPARCSDLQAKPLSL
jgi:hypothetical protein